MVVAQLIFIFLRSISCAFMLKFLLLCNGKTTDHFALTSNFTIDIDLENLTRYYRGVGRFPDLHLRYFQTENETIDKCSVSSKENNKRKSKVEFQCKCFDQAGTYQIVVVTDPVTFETTALKTINVFWPLIHVYLPETYSALSSGIGINVKFKTYKLACAPDKRSAEEHSSALELWRSDFVNKTSTKLKYSKERTIPVDKWWTLNSLTVPCKFFGRPGVYKVIVLADVNSTRSLDVISESNTMTVNVSADYRLKTISGSIFPCPTSGVAVTFEKFACESVGQKIRLWGVIVNDTSKTRHNKYIGEESVPPSKSVVNFGCNYFDLIYLEYCFQHTAVFDDGSVVELARQCVPTQKTKFMPVNGQWSEWKHWGPCTVTCNVGVQHRYKLCDNPKPKYHGKFCNGNGMDSKNCEMGPCPNVTTSNDHLDKKLFSSPCQCGCHLTKEETVVIESYSCTNLSVWTIEAPSNYIVKAKLLTFYLADVSTEWLKIRQSLNESGRLLFDSTTNVPSEKFEEIVLISKSNQMRIEYFSSNTKENAISTSAIWKGALIKTQFVKTGFGVISKSFNNYKFLLFIILPSISSAFLIIVLCVGWCFLFKNAKRKLSSKCRLLKSRSCGSIKENDPLIEEVKRLEVPINVVENGENNAKTSNDNTKIQTVQVSIENGDKEKQPLLVSKLRGKVPVANNLPQIPEEMFSSIHTQSTRLSTVTQKSGELSPPTACSSTKTVRSIGIQLSSPALPLKRQFDFGSKISIGTPSTLNNYHRDSTVDRSDSPTNLSIAGTEQDFEYDYSEYAVPGSILNPDYHLGETFFQSDISIDDIIAQCELMKPASSESTIHEKSSVSTQIQNDVDFCVKIPKPMKQFHFL